MDYEASRDTYFLAVEKQYEREIAGIFRDALNEIRAEISKIYEKYAVNGILTNAEMTRYNRLQALQRHLVEIVKPALDESIKILNNMKPDEYGEAYFRTAWAFDENTRVSLDWGALDKDAIAASLDNVFYKASLEIWKKTALIKINTAISNGLAMGQSYTEMMRYLKQFINNRNFEIMRILRTELHDAQEAGTIANYNDALAMGIEGGPIWVATLDGRTRETHGAMDGVKRKSDGLYHGAITAAYPGDPALPAAERINCRCTQRFEIEGFPPFIRRSREDGLIPYMSYSQWKVDHPTFKKRRAK